MKTIADYRTIADNYFTMNKEEKDKVCNVVIEDLVDLMKRNLIEEDERKSFLLEVIDSGIHLNEYFEKYEVAAVLKDIKDMILELDEQTD